MDDNGHLILQGGQSGLCQQFFERGFLHSSLHRCGNAFHQLFGAGAGEGESFFRSRFFREVKLLTKGFDFPKDTFGKSFALLQKDRLTFAEVCDEEQAPQGL